MIYFIILILFIFLAFSFDVLKRKRLLTFFYILEAIILILLATFRYRVGGDSLAYYDMYANLPTFRELSQYGFNNLEYQPLWYVLNAFTKQISSDFSFFQFVQALIVNVSVFVIVKRYSKHRFTTVLFYYVFLYLYFNFEILRESIAVVIFLFAYPKLFKKKYLEYFFLVTIAFLFHASALFLFFVPILVFLLKKNIKVLTLLLIGIIVSASSFLIVQLLINFLPVNAIIINKLTYYTMLEFNSNGIIMGIFRLIPILSIIYLLNKMNYKNEMFVPLVNIYFILALLSFIVGGISRLLNYFNLYFFIIVVELIIYGFRKYYSRNIIYKSVAILLFMVLFVDKGYYYSRDMSVYNYGNEAYFYNRYIPYYSVFDPQIDITREHIYYNSMSNNY